jgi:glucokinase
MPSPNSGERRAGVTTRAVARHNAALIIDVLRSRGPMPKSGIALHTGLSIATVNRLAEDLIGRGVLSEDPSNAMTGGRPARVVRYNGESRGVLVFDLGPQNTTAAIINMDGEPVHREVRPTASSAGETESLQIFEYLLGFAREIMELGQERCPIAGVAVGVPGVVRSSVGLVDFAPALRWWSMPLARRMEQELNVPVLAENDVNLLALAEHQRGAGMGTRDMVAISIGTGVGAGLILGSRLHHGWQGGAGEVGYMLMQPTSVAAEWPGFGDLESRIGMTGIRKRARAAGADDLPSLLADARAGSATARDAVESITDELAQAIANISVVVSPELVVIGGPIGRTAGHIVAGCARRLTGRIPTVPRIVLGELRDAVLLGAAELAIDHVLSLNTLQLPPSGGAAT